MNLNRKARTAHSLEQDISAIDLFCGAGGLTYGLEKAGVNVRLGVDVDPTCKFPYTTNNKAKFLLKDIESINANELRTALM